MGNIVDELRDYREGGGNLANIAEMLGGEIDGRTIRCPSPGRPPDDRSCCVRLDPARPSSFFIYDCEGSERTAYAYVRERLRLIAPAFVDRSPFALELWREAVPAAGTLVETYLRARAITIPPPPCLRFHPTLYHSPTRARWPGMVAERTGVKGIWVAIHRTYLRHDGHGKAPIEPPRMDFGPARGSAIRLAPVADELLIGEGIETTLSAMQATGWPGWAAGSAVAMRRLVLPPEVRKVCLLADGDDTGAAATLATAARWLAEGRVVRIARAPPGKDFNDVLIEEARS
jgi:hypothetical protein